MRLRFLKSTLIVTLILAALLAYPLSTWLIDVRSAVIAAGVMALINTVGGLLVIELTFDKPNFIFMAAFFGGMAVRGFFTLFVFALLLTQGFHSMALTFSLLGFYIVYMTLEIRYLLKVSKSKKYRGRR